MKHNAVFIAAWIATVLTGLNAGFFYTWSFTITGSLDLIEPHHAISAMQSINANIRSGWFAAIFFGSPLALLVTAIAVFRSRGAVAALWWFCALLAMGITLVLTTQVHVPMNNALATAPDSAWIEYSTRWTQWNHLRTAASTLALLLAIIGTARYQRVSVVGHN